MLIRALRADELPTIVRVYVDTFKATQRGIVSDAFIRALTYDTARERFQKILGKIERHPFGLLAERDGSVVGYAIGALAGSPPPGYQGELKTIYVLPEHHGLGIGRNLVRAVAGHFDQQSVRSMFLGVFSNNHPARRFYESLGGTVIDELPSEINGELFAVTRYGWPSTFDLANGNITPARG